MGQRHALWNLGLSGFPAAGLLGVAVAIIARRYPTTFLPGATTICVVGLACIAAAKLTVIRDGRLSSLGSGGMSAQYRSLYRIGYVLVASGAVGILLFALAWR